MFVKVVVSAVPGRRRSFERRRHIEMLESILVAFPSEGQGVVDHAFLSCRFMLSVSVQSQVTQSSTHSSLRVHQSL